jgi:deoxyribonuclease-4
VLPPRRGRRRGPRRRGAARRARDHPRPPRRGREDAAPRREQLRPRTGYGLDTCHLFAAGHDISESEAALAGVLDVFETVIGEPPAFFHLNDSEGALGSNKDRHALIGEGRIGLEPFRWLLKDRRTARVPLILETPQQNPNVAEDDLAPDPWDVRMMELLGGMGA